MSNITLRKKFRPILLVFLVAAILFFALSKQLDSWGINALVLQIGNVILFAVTYISFLFYTNALQTDNVHAMLRSMYGSMLVRMFICLIAAFIYIRAAGPNVSKGAIFACMFLYLVYTGMEVAALMKYGKQNKNV